MSFSETLAQLLKARFPVLYVETFEEQRALHRIAAVAGDEVLVRTPRGLWTWTLTGGLIPPDGKPRSGTHGAAGALQAVQRVDEPGVFVFRDLHPAHVDGQYPQNMELIRLLRDTAQAFRSGSQPRTLVLLSPVLSIPAELRKTVTLVEFPLPGAPDLHGLLDAMIRANAASGRIRIDLDDAGRERFVAAAAGLTMEEAENAFARAIANDAVLDLEDVRIVHDEKQQTVQKSGFLDFVPTEIVLDDVGGLGNLKAWLVKRNGSWLPEAAEWGLPAPRGVLITGVPGCGKSLTAKAMATAWNLPLLRLDVGRVFAGLVGSSEQNMRSALRVAEAVAPCVLWIDEIEKGFAGGAVGDSGTGARVFGTFLTWMQEKRRPVFVVATANDFEGLPPELLRKGRFDEAFFVDLPSRAERAAIWQVHLARALRHPRVAGDLLVDPDLRADLAGLTEGYSGAEIEQAVIAGLFDAFSERRPLRRDDLVRAVMSIVPLSVTQAERIAALRGWARNRAVPATATDDGDFRNETGSVR
ncbi:ATPase [Actinoplanes sp. SE50]|uniref:AAA family ATPase n=1 Tax=unclassified Actinoplanes TaxID=2626549 RepID=UPI00023ECAFC|nr:MULTISPECIES: AAA family ATPase [unclassified Actinoplanes]AEV83748.1 putative AAA domain-containing protein [Actinoplanes sp. SE50/110]ATO82108.1 ATPase [Actinoplanes sp. SE50]SLL99515.1 ATPase [Actinoplanes sp. SE50/110]